MHAKTHICKDEAEVADFIRDVELISVMPIKRYRGGILYRFQVRYK